MICNLKTAGIHDIKDIYEQKTFPASIILLQATQKLDGFRNKPIKLCNFIKTELYDFCEGIKLFFYSDGCFRAVSCKNPYIISEHKKLISYT